MLGVVIYLLCGAALATGCQGTRDDWKSSPARELGRFVFLTIFGPLGIVVAFILFFFSDLWMGRKGAANVPER